MSQQSLNDKIYPASLQSLGLILPIRRGRVQKRATQANKGPVRKRWCST